MRLNTLLKVLNTDNVKFVVVNIDGRRAAVGSVIGIENMLKGVLNVFVNELQEKTENTLVINCTTKKEA